MTSNQINRIRTFLATRQSILQFLSWSNDVKEEESLAIADAILNDSSKQNLDCVQHRKCISGKKDVDHKITMFTTKKSYLS